MKKTIQIPTSYGALILTIIGALLTMFIVHASETLAFDTEYALYDSTGMYDIR
jgi:hypothetical protein